MDKNITTPTAAALIIGNEILSGRTEDENISAIARKLASLGIPLVEVRVVPDVESRIVEALNALRSAYTYVFTTGGIGPTHDDITLFAIATAFGVPLLEHPDAVAALEAYYAPEPLNPARRRMALAPKGAVLIKNPVTAAPGVRMDNVFALAGVPEIMRGMLDAIGPLLVPGVKNAVCTVRCVCMPESVIADELTVLAAQERDVDIGSYPTFRQGAIGLALVVHGPDAVKVKKVAEALAEMIRAKGVVPQVSEGY